LNGVSAARRKRPKPPSLATSRSRFSPACAPRARPTSCDSDQGVPTIVLAKAYPASTFVGYDYPEPPLAAARERARAARVADRVSFEVAGAKTYPGRGFDLVAFFDCLHDMGDPAGAAAHVRQSLKPDGSG